VALGMVDVHGLVANVEIARNDQIWPFRTQSGEVVREGLEEIHFHLLPDVAHGPGWDVHRHDGEIAKIGPHQATLGIEGWMADSRVHRVGLGFG